MISPAELIKRAWNLLPILLFPIGAYLLLRVMVFISGGVFDPVLEGVALSEPEPELIASLVESIVSFVLTINFGLFAIAGLIIGVRKEAILDTWLSGLLLLFFLILICVSFYFCYLTYVTLIQQVSSQIIAVDVVINLVSFSAGFTYLSVLIVVMLAYLQFRRLEQVTAGGDDEVGGDE